MTPDERRSIRRDQVVRFLSTDMTARESCALNGVLESTLYVWMTRFRELEPELFGESNTSEWIELTRESISTRDRASRPRRRFGWRSNRIGAGRGAQGARFGAARRNACSLRLPERCGRRRAGRRLGAARGTRAQGGGRFVDGKLIYQRRGKEFFRPMVSRISQGPVTSFSIDSARTSSQAPVRRFSR